MNSIMNEYLEAEFIFSRRYKIRMLVIQFKLALKAQDYSIKYN